jgi:hypothetical protein
MADPLEVVAARIARLALRIVPGLGRVGPGPVLTTPERRQICQGWKAGEAARGRLVAIGAAMVRSGMAWANTGYSLRYLLEEGQARFERAGVHAKRCASPAAWRAGHPR